MATKAPTPLSSIAFEPSAPAVSKTSSLARVRAETYARGPVQTVAAATPIGVVLALLEQREISALPVTAVDGSPLGVVSRSDLLRTASSGYQSEALRAYSFERSTMVASDAMHRGVIALPRGSSMADVGRSMAKHRVHRVFLEDERRRLVGVVGTREVMAAISDARWSSHVDTIMSRRPFTVPREMSIALAIGRLSTAKAQGLVVVDADVWPVGLFTQREALLARNLPAKASVEEVMSNALLFMSADTPVHRAAARGAETLARRVLVVDKAKLAGLVAPLDFARLAAQGG